ncbi:hypothetical protein [uncultured Mailhella sp.]|uniref:hypothetical protein n=1 Tax=uncultured Mailhella sp. TaxID=1981031 RepID=UPI0025F8867D|nr:hypothetical protein [uncultured Mailhella sp.]
MKRIFGVFLAFSFCVLMVFTGCGRKGAPVPDYSVDEFAFGALKAEAAADGSITFQGTVTGASQNLEYMVLEMQAVDGELCEGCPFLAQDQYRIDSRDAWESDSGSSFSFVYRPVFSGEAYRWRLIGHNLYSGLPDVTSPMQTVFMTGASGALSAPVSGE